MRVALGIVIATLTLGLGYGPALAQTDAGWLYSIHMFDALTGWAVDANGDNGNLAKFAVASVVRTTDGGIHWKDITPPDPPGHKIARGGHIFQVDWLNSLVGWMPADLDTPAYPAPPTTLLFHTVDGGRTWRSAPTPDSFYRSIQFINARDGWMLASAPSAVSTEADFYRSTNAGETWTKIGPRLTSAKFAGLGPITFLNATIRWITPASAFGPEWISLFVTHDGGYTWQEQRLLLPPQTMPRSAAAMPPTFFTARDGILPVSVLHSGILLYRTHDGGTTWTHTTPAPVKSYVTPLALADIDHAWVTDGDALYVTSDGGHQWTMVRAGPPFAYVGQIDFISPQVGWAAGRAGNPPFLLKTVDGGHTWISLPYTISRQ